MLVPYLRTWRRFDKSFCLDRGAMPVWLKDRATAAIDVVMVAGQIHITEQDPNFSD